MPITQENKVDFRDFNNAFLDKLSNPVMEKESAVNLGSFIRDRVREDSFLGNILTELPITSADLDPDVDLDRVHKIVEIEPDSYARWMSFRDMPESTYIHQRAVSVPFGSITTPETVKNINELRTRKTDVRKVLTDNHVKDIMAQKDGKWVQLTDETCVKFGRFQNYNNGFTKNNVIEMTKPFEDVKIPLACILINSKTAKDILKWDTDDLGFEPVSTFFKNGLTVTEIWGYKLVITNKREFVPDYTAYLYGQEDFLGRVFILDDVNSYFEQKGLYIKFFAYMTLGAALINEKAVWKATFF